jgi:hypothetical protein
MRAPWKLGQEGLHGLLLFLVIRLILRSVSTCEPNAKGDVVRIRMFGLLGASVALGTLAIAALSTPAGAASPNEYGVSSAHAWQPGTTLNQLRTMASTGDITLVQAGGVVPATATPSGYTLLHPGYRRSDYIYDSDYIYQDDVYCNPTCVLKAETKVQEHQYVRGGASKYWDLQENAATSQNPGGLSWTYTAIYYCGVNIKGAADHTCGNGADASGTSAPMTPGENVGKKFENVSGNTVFPMVGISTHFNTGIVVTTKFRGYDTLNRATTTKLNTTSDNGS